MKHIAIFKNLLDFDKQIHHQMFFKNTKIVCQSVF